MTGLFEDVTNPNETLPVFLEIEFHPDEPVARALGQIMRQLRSSDVGTPNPSWTTRGSA